MKVTGKTILSNTTESTSVTTGSLVVSGGVGISSDVYIGGDTTITGTTTINNALRVTGQSLLINTTESYNTTTGSLVVLGGVGISSDVYIGGFLSACIPIISKVDLLDIRHIINNPNFHKKRGKIVIVEDNPGTIGTDNYLAYASGDTFPDAWILLNGLGTALSPILTHV
jgi:hypothetical protein